jgi:hypothetical protein
MKLDYVSRGTGQHEVKRPVPIEIGKNSSVHVLAYDLLSIQFKLTGLATPVFLMYATIGNSENVAPSIAINVAK